MTEIDLALLIGFVGGLGLGILIGWNMGQSQAKDK